MGGLVFEKLTQGLAANQVWPLRIAADEARIVASTYPVTLEFRFMGQAIGRAANVQAGDYFRKLSFDEVVVVNGANAQTVTLGLVSGQSGSDRITGEVSVISGEVVRSRSGLSFWGGGGIAAGAGVYSHCQLWNPVVSQRVLVVKQIIGSAGPGAAGGFNVMSSSAPLAGLYATPNALSKKLGGVASIAENRIENNAAKLGGFMAGVYTMAGESKQVAMAEPIIVNPGYGLIVVGYQVNQTISCIVQFYEEAL